MYRRKSPALGARRSGVWNCCVTIGQAALLSELVPSDVMWSLCCAKIHTVLLSTFPACYRLPAHSVTLSLQAPAGAVNPRRTEAVHFSTCVPCLVQLHIMALRNRMKQDFCSERSSKSCSSPRFPSDMMTPTGLSGNSTSLICYLRPRGITEKQRH